MIFDDQSQLLIKGVNWEQRPATGPALVTNKEWKPMLTQCRLRQDSIAKVDDPLFVA